MEKWVRRQNKVEHKSLVNEGQKRTLPTPRKGLWIFFHLTSPPAPLLMINSLHIMLTGSMFGARLECAKANNHTEYFLHVVV